MQVLFYLFCLVFLLPACRVRRQSMAEEQVCITDTSAISDTCSSLLERRIHTTDLSNWKVTRFVLSPPDSSGRQYPAEVTLLQANEFHHTTDTLGETHHSSLKATHQQTTLSSSSSQKVYKQSFPVWIWVVVGIALLFFILEIRKC